MREEREKALRLERELEGWKALRVEKGASMSGGSIRRSGQWRTGSEWSDEHPSGGVDVPQRKSSLSRQMSMTKGFL